MKKIASVAAIALFAVAFTSCKKDYKCTCTWTVSGQSMTQTYDLGKQKKSDAKSACDGKSVTTNGISYSCSLD